MMQRALFTQKWLNCFFSKLSNYFFSQLSEQTKCLKLQGDVENILMSVKPRIFWLNTKLESYFGFLIKCDSSYLFPWKFSYKQGQISLRKNNYLFDFNKNFYSKFVVVLTRGKFCTTKHWKCWNNVWFFKSIAAV